jgi:hypothetical protein
MFDSCAIEKKKKKTNRSLKLSFHVYMHTKKNQVAF